MELLFTWWLMQKIWIRRSARHSGLVWRKLRLKFDDGSLAQPWRSVREQTISRVKWDLGLERMGVTRDFSADLDDENRRSTKKKKKKVKNDDTAAAGSLRAETKTIGTYLEPFYLWELLYGVATWCDRRCREPEKLDDLRDGLCDRIRTIPTTNCAGRRLGQEVAAIDEVHQELNSCVGGVVEGTGSSTTSRAVHENSGGETGGWADEEDNCGISRYRQVWWLINRHSVNGVGRTTTTAISYFIFYFQKISLTPLIGYESDLRDKQTVIDYF